MQYSSHQRRPKVYSHPSGARVVLVPFDGPMTTVSVWFRAGSRFDPHSRPGVAHFFEHLFMGRTVREPNKTERFTRLAARGISYNAHTSYETAYYHCTQPTSETAFALDFLLDGAANTIVTTEDVAHEKAAILTEEAANRSNPAEFSWRAGNDALWPGSSLGRGFFGTPADIAAVSLGDIAAFRNAYYGVRRMTVMVVGDIKEADVDTAIAARFPGIATPDIIAPQREMFSEPLHRTSHVHPGDSETLNFCWRIPGQNGLLPRVTLEILAQALGGTMLSRLVRGMRFEKDIAYWVNADIELFSDTGRLRVMTTVASSNTPLAIASVAAEIDRLRSEMMPANEQQGHMRTFASRMLRITMDPLESTWWYGWQFMIAGSLYTPTDAIRASEVVTPASLQEAATSLGSVSLVGIGPASID
ncbi:MAG: hypothetical protein RLZZ324_944 [Candidatus Parcubacteria bacterium]|jgi:predicted Zn-dependent peptidase